VALVVADSAAQAGTLSTTSVSSETVLMFLDHSHYPTLLIGMLSNIRLALRLISCEAVFSVMALSVACGTFLRVWVLGNRSLCSG
jgi:hypothetical protein